MIDTRVLVAGAATLLAVPVIVAAAVGSGDGDTSAANSTAQPSVERSEPRELSRSDLLDSHVASLTIASTPRHPAARFGPIETTRPTIRIDAPNHLAFTDEVDALPGVTHATGVTTGRLRIDVGDEELLVAVIDPTEFRALVPQPTADAAELWAYVDDGEAAFTHETADELSVPLGGYVHFGDGDGAVEIRVAGFASNGTPPVADVIVNRRTGALLDLEDPITSVLVAVEEGAQAEVVTERIERLLGSGGGDVEIIPDPRPARAVTSADAETAETVWDLLAICESSGDWHINTGNGYYGGLQFLPESWWMVGGTGMPHEASREEQIHRAELLLELQGWEAWPACSLKLGLRDPP